jgi:hypothetical protein
MSQQRPPRETYKAMLWDYDFLLGQSDDECCFSLSAREVQILLAQVDYIGWKTRYKPTSTEIDQSVILLWQGNLVRKLMGGCCPDDGTLTRFTSDGVFQESDDGGLTWHDAPESDPRNQGVLVSPLGEASDAVKCAAADNVRGSFVAMRDNLITLLTAGTTVIAIIAGIAGFIGVVLGISGAATAIGVLLLGFAAAALTLTPESVEAQIDDAALDDFKCLVYCNMEDNGQFTYEGWQALMDALPGTFSDFPYTFFSSIVSSLGYIGMSNAGTMGADSASDCDGCDCECDGETIGLTMDLFYGGSPAQTGCNVQADSLADGDGFTLSWQWDGVHPFKLTAEGILSGTVGSPTSWQWYDASGAGPFSNPAAPIGASLSVLNIHGTGGTSFRDVATP